MAFMSASEMLGNPKLKESDYIRKMFWSASTPPHLPKYLESDSALAQRFL
jgi:hypothetical protein